MLVSCLMSEQLSFEGSHAMSHYREQQDQSQKIRNLREQIERERESKKLSVLVARVRQLAEARRGESQHMAA